MTKAQIDITAADKTRTAFSSVDRNLAGMRAAAASTVATLGGIGAALGVGFFASTIKGAIDAADEISKLSQKTGLSVTTLAGLQFAADQAGTSLDGVSLGVKKLATFMIDADDGNKEYQKTLKALGLTARDPEKALIQLADQFAKMPDSLRKTALAQELLGKSGLDLIPILNQGGDALSEQIRLGQKYNPITEESARQAEQFNDQLDELKTGVTSVGIALSVNMLGPLTKITDAMNQAAREGGVFAGVMAGFSETFHQIVTPSDITRVQQLKGDIKALKEVIASPDNLTQFSDFLGGEATVRNTENLLKKTKELADLEAKIARDSKAESDASAVKKPTVSNFKIDDGSAQKAAEAAARSNRQAIIAAEERLQSAQKLSSVLQTTYDIEQGKYKGLSTATKQRLIEISAEIDATASRQKLDQDQEALAKKNTEEGIARFKALQDAGASVYASTRTDAQDYEAEVIKLNDLLAQGAITQDTYNIALKNTQDEYQKTASSAAATGDQMSQFAIQASRSMQTAFAQFLFDPFDKGLKGMALGFLNTVHQMAANAASTHILESLFGGLASGGGKGGGLLGGLLGGVAKGIFGAFGFASGGDFAGGMRLVGEQGPELEVTGPSRIFNANQTKQILSGGGGGGGGGGDIINVNLNIQTGVQQTVRAEFMSMIPLIRKEAVVAVSTAKRRGKYSE